MSAIRLQWGVRIALRDGVHLNATLYLPRELAEPAPSIFTLTPYVGQTYHDRGVYFAAHGYPFLTVDVRGRGNSEGEFEPNRREANDGHDVVEWIARQPWCNGKVAMWGGSYSGLAQWNTARAQPAHLATIVPVAAPFMGVDFPMRGNQPSPYLLQWLALVAGRTSQERLFADREFWSGQYRRWFESGEAFRSLDRRVGLPSPLFQEWLDHPEQGEYWDRYNPSAAQYASMVLPVLTITGAYDGDQPGALAHYREHLRNAREAKHFLVIGPWDHAGTRNPKTEVAGLTLGPDSVVDLNELHLQWYAWTMRAGPQPAFLKAPVAYYVMGAEKWRYARTLEEIAVESMSLYLTSGGDASRLSSCGALSSHPGHPKVDSYVYDPKDTSVVAVEAASTAPLSLRPTFPVDELTDQSLIHAAEGKQLVYQSPPFESELTVCGFFRLRAWISIDQPDTDFRVCVYEIERDGRSILLSSDSLRARYRESAREARLIGTTDPLLYDSRGFTFVARRLALGSRLRLVLGPVNSMYSQKNYNSGRPVAEETQNDARVVTVRLFHGGEHLSALYVPLGRNAG